MSRMIRFAVPGLLLVTVALPSASTAAVSHNALGNRLVNRYLSDLQRHDVADLRVFLSPAFQIQRADGSRTTKAQFLGNPTRISSYKIRGMRATSDANVLVATFQNKVTGLVINGKPYGSGYSPRLMTFVKVARGWQVLALANFNTPVAPPPLAG